MEPWALWKRPSVALVFRQIGSAPGERAHIVFRNSRPQPPVSVLLGVSDGFALSSYGFGSCVTGVLVSWGCV